MTRAQGLSLEFAGAVAGEGLDAMVAAHFGDPMGEQRHLAQGTGVVDLSHRCVITIGGSQRLSWLHSLTTQHVVDLEPGRSVESLVLDPRGRIESHLRLVDDGERAWLIVDGHTRDIVLPWLQRMVFTLDVRVDDVSDQYVVVGSPAGLIAAGVEPGLAVVEWTDPWPTVGVDTCRYTKVADTDHPGQSWRWVESVVSREEVGQVFDRSRPCGTWALEALRIAAWRPRLGVDSDATTIPHELDWLRTSTHLHKGCYRGQETVARVVNIGAPPKRLVFLHLDGSEHELPESGQNVTLRSTGAVVGTLGSVARHFELGPIGLARLKRSCPVDAPLDIGVIAAQQEEIVTPTGIPDVREGRARPTVRVLRPGGAPPASPGSMR